MGDSVNAIVVADIALAPEAPSMVPVGRRETSRDGHQAVHVADEPSPEEDGGGHGSAEHGNPRPWETGGLWPDGGGDGIHARESLECWGWNGEQ